MLIGGAGSAATMYNGTYETTNVETNSNPHTVGLPNLISQPYNNYWQFVGGTGTLTVDSVSAWSSWSVNDNQFGITASTGYQYGDLNVNLAPVPLPAA